MKTTQILMDMPITVEVIDKGITEAIISKVFEYFKYIDNKFSIYRPESEISLINKGKITTSNYSRDMATVFSLCHKTKKETYGYFDVQRNGKFDLSGLVKGWAVYHAAKILEKYEFNNYYVDAGGDIQVKGTNLHGKKWKIGIRNPKNRQEIVKIIYVTNKGVATSGTYIRGQHIYNPHQPEQKLNNIISLTVIGPNIYEADRFATAAFAMGRKGIKFIENLRGFEGYMIDNKESATFTTGFNNYTSEYDRNN